MEIELGNYLYILGSLTQKSKFLSLPNDERETEQPHNSAEWPHSQFSYMSFQCRIVATSFTYEKPTKNKKYPQ